MNNLTTTYETSTTLIVSSDIILNAANGTSHFLTR
jgi:hypothetical protein